MWGKCIKLLLYVLAVAILVFTVIDKKHRRLWIVCLVLSGIASAFTSMVPIENVFYSFPSAEAVAKYACKGEIIEILNGEESSMILYAKEPGSVSYMLSNKTEKGYKIGTQWSMRRHSHLTLNPPAPIRIYESTNKVDQYIFLFGMVEGKDVVLSDTQGNRFLVFGNASTHTGVEMTSFEAFCILNNTVDESYEITINSTKALITLKPENY